MRTLPSRSMTSLAWQTRDRGGQGRQEHVPLSSRTGCAKRIGSPNVNEGRRNLRKRPYLRYLDGPPCSGNRRKDGRTADERNERKMPAGSIFVDTNVFFYSMIDRNPGKQQQVAIWLEAWRIGRAAHKSASANEFTTCRAAKKWSERPPDTVFPIVETNSRRSATSRVDRRGGSARWIHMRYAIPGGIACCLPRRSNSAAATSCPRICRTGTESKA